MLDWVPVDLFSHFVSFFVFENTWCGVLQVISSLQLGMAILVWFMFWFVRATDGKIADSLGTTVAINCPSNMELKTFFVMHLLINFPSAPCMEYLPMYIYSFTLNLGHM